MSSALLKCTKMQVENAILNNLVISWKMIIIPLDEEVGDKDEQKPPMQIMSCHMVRLNKMKSYLNWG